MSVAELIEKCKKKELQAQEQLYRIYAGKLFSVSLKYSPSYAQAEDNLQEAFMTIFEKINQFKNKGSFEGWLKRIVVNTALQKYRQPPVYQIGEKANLEAEELEVETDDLPLPYLLKLIQELPDRYRMVFNLYVLDGFSHKEIAKMMQISTGTSKSNLARARKILQEKIECQTNVKQAKSL